MDPQVTGVPRLVDQFGFDRPLHSTALLVGVRAVREPAQCDEWSELDKEPLDLLGDHVPECQLPDSGRIDDIATVVEFNQLGAAGDMPSLAGGLADFSGDQPQARLDHVEQRRLANTTLTGKDRLAIRQKLPEPRNPRTGLGTGEHHLVSESRVESGPSDQGRGIKQIDLVQADHRGNLALLGTDQEPVDQGGLEIICGNDDDELVNVRDDQVGTLPAAARQHTVTRLDSLNDPCLSIDVTNQHPIAGDHCIPLVPDQ